MTNTSSLLEKLFQRLHFEVTGLWLRVAEQVDVAGGV
jgi:hypothetical protein